MKGILLFTIFILFSVLLSAQQYRVVSKSTLNVRLSASTNGKIIGQLQNNETVYVYEVSNGWAKIKHGQQDAYINSSYIQLIEKPVEVASVTDWGLKNDRSFQANFLYVIIAILILLTLKGSAFSDAPFSTFDTVLLGIVCTLELIYYFVIHSGFPPEGHLWFTLVRKVGFFTAIFNAILLFAFGFLQLGMLFNYWDSINLGTDDSNSRHVGLLLALPLVALLYFEGFFIVINGMNPILATLLAIYGIGQIWQIIQLLSNGYGVWTIYIYTVSMAATVLVFTDGPGFISFFIDNVAY